jgi:glycosyltransferase involved in cell wall biosynthesis
MLNMHPISFFIPAYNCAATIEEAVNSIINGNFSPGDELVITNDCSSDGTALILEKLKIENPHIKVITHKYNKGGGAARNTSIENSKHKLLFCLDSDNVLAPNSIEKLKAYLIDNEADVVAFQHLKYFSKSTALTDNTWTITEGVFTKQDLFSKAFSPGAGGNYLFTKESWQKAGGYPEYSGALDTWGFGLRQLMSGAKMMVLKDSFYHHRLIQDSYYLRDAWNRRKSVSLRALQLLIPYLDYIADRDIEYIFSKRHRYLWMENIEKRPLTISDEPKKNAVWITHELPAKGWKPFLKKLLKLNQ